MDQIWRIIEGEVKNAFWVWGLKKWINEGFKQEWTVK